MDERDLMDDTRIIEGGLEGPRPDQENISSVDFDIVRSNRDFQELAQIVQQNPAMLEAILQQLEQADPILATPLAQDREGFVRLMFEGTGLYEEADPFPTRGLTDQVEDRPDFEHVETIEGVDPDTEMTDEEVANYQLALMIQAQEDAGFENRHSDRNVPPEQFECACGEIYTNTADQVHLNCGCVRCVECLNQNVSVGLECKKNFPPKCHGPIDIDDILHHLQPEVVARWMEVQEEYTDLAPVYCAVKTCSKYLNKATFTNEGQWAKCDNCAKLTCTACSALNTDHEGDSCPERLEKMDRELMEKKKWKPCPGCKEMIEKSEGCDHMSCECGQEFCYQCGRAYNGGLPCNCTGEREWVEDDPDENNPEVQQQLLDEFATDGGDDGGQLAENDRVSELQELRDRVLDVRDEIVHDPEPVDVNTVTGESNEGGGGSSSNYWTIDADEFAAHLDTVQGFFDLIDDMHETVGTARTFARHSPETRQYVLARLDELHLVLTTALVNAPINQEEDRRPETEPAGPVGFPSFDQGAFAGWGDGDHAHIDDWGHIPEPPPETNET